MSLLTILLHIRTTEELQRCLKSCASVVSTSNCFTRPTHDWMGFTLCICD